MRIEGPIAWASGLDLDAMGEDWVQLSKAEEQRDCYAAELRVLQERIVRCSESFECAYARCRRGRILMGEGKAFLISIGFSKRSAQYRLQQKVRRFLACVATPPVQSLVCVNGIRS